MKVEILFCLCITMVWGVAPVRLFTALGALPAARIVSSRLISDHMVLQREHPVPVWGSATPGGAVVVRFRDQERSAVADEQGQWRVVLDPMAAGGPFEMQIVGERTLTLRNVMVGEVWLCSGQSNMAMALVDTENAAAEIAAADFPSIRLFTVPATVVPGGPHAALSGGEWVPCSPDTVSRFSGAAYYFGRALYRELDVAIGLIVAARGGTAAATWTDRRAMAAQDELRPIVERYERVLANYPSRHEAFLAETEQWQAFDRQIDEMGDARSDPGDPGLDAGYALPEFDDSDWQAFRFRMPRWTGNSVVWFRKRFDPKALLDGSTEWEIQGLQLVGAYRLYLDGELIAGSDAVEAHRIEQRIAATPGEKVLALRVFSHRPVAALHTFPAIQSIRNPENKVVLGGTWGYAVGVADPATPFDLVSHPFPPYGPLHPGAPGNLFDNMIYPLAPYALRGAAWYQGESNVRWAADYPVLLQTLIASWRDLWNQGPFPFLVVQLANFGAAPDQPSESSWAELREAQARVLAWKNMGLVTTIDVGDAQDIHPKDKRTVGERLALSALGVAYDRDGIHLGPTYDGMHIEGDSIVVRFTNIGKGLVARDGPLRQFAIAGSDRRFVWATAQIIDDAVRVRHPAVTEPVAVRYAWADNPEGCNLYNHAGLPAVPFRTDDWASAETP